jgi:hypothetical protein
MKSSASQRILTLLLIPASLLLLLAACELFFRVVAPAPDIPQPAYIDGVLRHRPGQRGVYWSAPFGQDGMRAPFSINAQGWNSARPDYPEQRTAAPRIAVVGDSYVEALQVPSDASLAEDLERELPGVEVFRYGMSGAPLSQYLHMARRAALPAHPDVLVVLLVHNDFDESYREVPGMFTRSFLKLRLDAEDQVQELPPTPYVQSLTSHIRNMSATWRYLAYGRQLRFDTLRRIFLRQGQDRRFEANIDISDLKQREELDRRAARYLFSRLKAESATVGARLLLVMDGVRASIEAGVPTAPDGAYRLNRLAEEEAAGLGIPLLDLHPVFATDFKAQHKPLAFPTDGHWNAHAHAVAAHAVAAELRRLGWDTGR